MTNTSEIRPLTSLRMIAALLVLFHHFYKPPVLNFSLLEGIHMEGHIGVTLFFTLSGFLITLRYFDDFQQGLSRRLIFNYVSRRIARIYPLYFGLMLISLMASNEAFFSVGTLFVMTLTQSFFGDYKFHGISTAWSLRVEEHFYLLAIFVFGSLALALIQATIFIKPIMELVAPFAGTPLLYATLVYIGLNFVAALLYEWVEQPGREAVLRRAKRLEPYFTPGSRQTNAAPVGESSGESSV